MLLVNNADRRNYDDALSYLTTALTALLVLSASAAQAGTKLNGPALEGRQVALPDKLPIAGAPATEEVRFGDPGIHFNGPALDGRQVALPDRLPIAGAPAAEEVRFGGDGVHWNGPALDGRQVPLPLDGAPVEPMAEPPKE